MCIVSMKELSSIIFYSLQFYNFLNHSTLYKNLISSLTNAYVNLIILLRFDYDQETALKLRVIDVKIYHYN